MAHSLSPWPSAALPSHAALTRASPFPKRLFGTSTPIAVERGRLLHSIARHASFLRSSASDEASPFMQSRVFLTHTITSGEVAVRPLAIDDVQDTAALLTRAFLPAPESITGRDAKDFCLRALFSPPRAMMLVAHLAPYDHTELGPAQLRRIVGLTHLSLSPDTRPLFHQGQPPDHAAYISSMAVDAKYRRQGVARLLIEASEALCVSMNVQLLCLHAWSNDPIAQRCYRSCDFRFVEKQYRPTPVPFWQPARRRLLMQKELHV